MGEGTSLSNEIAAKRSRQWVTLRNGSMDMRCSIGNVATCAHDLRSAVGKPHSCALVHDQDAPAEKLEALRVDLCDQGFAVKVIDMPGTTCDFSSAEAFAVALGEASITGDDLVCVMGHDAALSVASLVCGQWCGGVSVALIPLDLTSAVTSGVTPHALNVPGYGDLLSQNGVARFEIVDLSLIDIDPSSEDVSHALALMVASATADSDKAFGRLWDNSEKLAAGDVDTYVDQVVDTVKSRGRVISSSALAVRQSIEYGQDFARALATLTGDQTTPAVRLADGLRFSARLSVAQDNFTIDDMLTQDELLERLGIGTTEVSVDAEALIDALKAQRFARSSRFMLPLPRTIGRVRLTVVEDALVREHVEAWCETRPVA